MSDNTVKVLLIEDDSLDADLIHGMLKDAGKASFIVEVRDTLVKGLERLAKGGIDIVLLDLTLPDSIGLDTFGRVHAHAPLVPIVVITSSADENQAATAFQKGAQEYLVKEQLNAELVSRSIRYAIERNKVRVELHSVQERLEKINSCFLKFGEEPYENIRHLTSVFGELLGATCALYNCLDRDGMLCSMSQWQAPADYKLKNRPEGRICYDVIKEGDGGAFIVRNLQNTKYAETDPNVKRYKLETYIGYPIKLNGEVIGSLCAVYQKDFVPSEDDMRLVSVIAAGVEVEERRACAEDELRRVNRDLLVSNKRLNQLSLRDLHTGLYNHRYLAEIVDAEFHRSRKLGGAIAVIMLDVDYFKSINDIYGHPFGDMVLKQLAQQLKMMTRQYDVVIRYGGEEFIIMSPGTDRAHALMLAQRILEAVNLHSFGNTETSVKLKVSLAAISYPEDKVTYAMDLVKLSETILVKAKEDGGSRVYSSMDKGSRSKSAQQRDKSPNIGILRHRLDKLHKEANESLTESVLAFAKTIEVKDHYTGEHVERTVKYATGIAKALDLSPSEIEMVRQAAMLHDLGKIGISESILNKKAKLTDKEIEDIRKHPKIAADILRPIHVLNAIIPFILYHHERWDGKGYPTKLKGEDIPLGARIVAIADVYQALVSKRPYRKAFSKLKALKIIKEASGTQFDPHIVDIFLDVIKKEKSE
ncbi:MAG: diguanylate cyclase [Candidatus Omnitrophota bacterium]|nr:diguanylate cyclase [Candidatus Omnitrophota bacterium]